MTGLPNHFVYSFIDTPSPMNPVNEMNAVNAVNAVNAANAVNEKRLTEPSDCQPCRFQGSGFALPLALAPAAKYPQQPCQPEANQGDAAQTRQHQYAEC